MAHLFGTGDATFGGWACWDGEFSSFKTLENKQKTHKQTMKFPARKTPKRQKQQGKEGHDKFVGVAAHCMGWFEVYLVGYARPLGNWPLFYKISMHWVLLWFGRQGLAFCFVLSPTGAFHLCPAFLPALWNQGFSNDPRGWLYSKNWRYHTCGHHSLLARWDCQGCESLCQRRGRPDRRGAASGFQQEDGSDNNAQMQSKLQTTFSSACKAGRSWESSRSIELVHVLRARTPFKNESRLSDPLFTVSALAIP